MTNRHRSWTIFAILMLLILVAVLGYQLPLQASQRLRPSTISITPSPSHTSPSPFPTCTPTALPSPTHTSTSTPTATSTPAPTVTPMPSPTATPTLPAPLLTLLTEDDAFAELVCQSDKEYRLQQGQIIVPILLYHFVGRDVLEPGGISTTRYNVTAEDFEAQLALLKQLGYHTVTISEIVNAINHEGVLPERPVAITVDDGWVEQYTKIFPLLKRYEMRATFYIPSTYPVGGRFVTWDQLKEMVADGMEIGSHTRKHVDLTTVDLEQAAYEISNSKQVLEEKLGITVSSISYPFGNYSSGVIALVREAGYQSAVALGPTLKQSSRNLYALNRYEVFGTRSLAEFVSFLPWRGNGLPLCAGD